MKPGKKTQKLTSANDSKQARVTRARVKKLQETVNNDVQSKSSGKEADNSTPQTALTIDNNMASLEFLEKYDTACKPKFLDYKLVQKPYFCTCSGK
jgi:hypothetical protein